MYTAWFFGSGKEISVDMSVEAGWRVCVSECGWKTGLCLPSVYCAALHWTLEGGSRWRTFTAAAAAAAGGGGGETAANNRRSALAP